MLKSLFNRLQPSPRCSCTLGHLAWCAVLLVVFLTWGHLA